MLEGDSRGIKNMNFIRRLQVSKETAADKVETAIRLGHRHLDVAAHYGNEKEVTR